MGNEALFITIPLAFLAYLVAIGIFENDGALEKLRNKRSQFHKILFYPLIYEVPDDADILDGSHSLSRIFAYISVPLYFFMALCGYAQYLMEDPAGKVFSTIYVVLVLASLIIALT